MAVQTLTMPSADEQHKLVRNRTRKSNNETIGLSQKFAVVLLKLAPAVDQSDYPALKAAMENIAGIQNASLLVDGITDATCPPANELRLVSDVQVRIDSLPEEE